MEIERKYLIDIQSLNFPLSTYQKKEIEQGYISIKPVIRIRKSNNQYILTIKGNGLMAREEHELYITQDEYHHLSNKLEYPIIKKTRYLIPYNNLTIELDIFHNHLTGLSIAEVEFNSLAEANVFIPPAWFGNDVTNESKYQNNHLCQLKNINNLL